MTDEPITVENVSLEAIQRALRGAGLSSHCTDDNLLVVPFAVTLRDASGKEFLKAGIECFVTADRDRQVIQVQQQIAFKSTVSMLERLKCANNINVRTQMAGALVTPDGRLGFMLHIPLQGGLSAARLAGILKRWALIPPDAIQTHAKDLVE